MDQHVYDWGEKKNGNPTRCCRWKSMWEGKSQFISRNENKAQALKLWNRLALFQKIATFVVFFLFLLTTFVSRGACNTDTTSFTAVPFEKLQMVSSTDLWCSAWESIPAPWFAYMVLFSTGCLLNTHRRRSFFFWGGGLFKFDRLHKCTPLIPSCDAFRAIGLPLPTGRYADAEKQTKSDFSTLLFFSQLSDNSWATAPVFPPDIYLLELVSFFSFFFWGQAEAK